MLPPAPFISSVARCCAQASRGSEFLQSTDSPGFAALLQDGGVISVGFYQVLPYMSDARGLLNFAAEGIRCLSPTDWSLSLSLSHTHTHTLTHTHIHTPSLSRAISLSLSLPPSLSLP